MCNFTSLQMLKTKLKTTLSLTLAVAIGAVGGYWGASVNQTETALIQQKLSTKVKQSELNSGLNDEQSATSRADEKSLNTTSNATTSLLPQDAPEGIFYNDFNPNVETIVAGIQSLQEMLTAKDFKAIAKVKQQLLTKAKQDSEALDQLINTFIENSSDPAVKEEIMQVLAAIKDPKVEQLAQELAVSGGRESRLSGLGLLASLQIPSKETLDLAVSTLSQNNDDPELLEAAMHAMPKMTISLEKNSEILVTLTELSQHENESVRSSSLFLIAQQAKVGEQLQPLIKALNSGSIDDRISAAMGLEQSNVTSPELKSVLLAKMKNPMALPEVRAMSANSLNRFSLSSEELSDIETFRETQKWNGGR